MEYCVLSHCWPQPSLYVERYNFFTETARDRDRTKFTRRTARARVKQTLVQMQVRLQQLCNYYNARIKNLDDFLRVVARNIRINLN